MTLKEIIGVAALIPVMACSGLQVSQPESEKLPQPIFSYHNEKVIPMGFEDVDGDGDKDFIFYTQNPLNGNLTEWYLENIDGFPFGPQIYRR